MVNPKDETICRSIEGILNFWIAYQHYLLSQIWVKDETCIASLSILYLKKIQWSHNGRDGVSYHQPYHYLLDHLFRRRSKKTSKLRVTGLCEGNSPVTGEFSAQMASNAENDSIWWRHHECVCPWYGSGAAVVYSFYQYGLGDIIRSKQRDKIDCTEAVQLDVRRPTRHSGS